MSSLQKFEYTHLRIQYGKDSRSIFENFLLNHPPGTAGRHGIQIDGFDFNQAGLEQEMRLTKEDASGMIISHAGSGSILEALRLGVPLVVVPNPTLKDNHQEELAQELQRQGYVVASHYKDIAAAIGQAESLRERMSAWPPSRDEKQKDRPTLASVIADEMGFLD